MASPELATRLEDILEAIAVIGAYTAGKTQVDYTAERMLRDAVERNLKRISEASRHIPRSLKAKHRRFHGGRSPASANILRRDYPIVDDSLFGNWWTRRRWQLQCSRCCASWGLTRPASEVPWGPARAGRFATEPQAHARRAGVAGLITMDAIGRRKDPNRRRQEDRCRDRPYSDHDRLGVA